MKNILTFCLFIAIVATSIGSSFSQEFSEPKFIEGSDNTFSAYPGSESKMARTARVWVSYMVSKEGSVFEPMIEQINNDRFSANVLKWVSLRRHEPAMYDGAPIDSWVRERFGFNIAYYENSPFVSTKLFNKYYKNFNDEIAKENPARKKLEKWLNKMAGAKHGSPLAYEFLSSARYKFTALFLDRDAQIKALKEMILSNDRGLAMANGKAVDIELVKLTIEAGYYGEAVDSYYQALSKHSSSIDKELKQLFEPTILQIEDILNTDKAFARPVSIGEEGYAYLPLSKRGFSFDSVEGQLTSIKLRCLRKFSELQFTTESDFQIPESWGECQLQILGTPGSGANLVQF